MADEIEGQDTGAEAVAGGVDPAAVALALNAANSDPSIAEDARAYLRKQSALADFQIHHVAEQSKYLREQFKRLKMGVISDRLSITLKVLTGFVGLAVAVGLATMIWDAAHANGLIIESFSVPPDMASRGLTGQVVATQMLDKLSAMQSVTGTTRPAQSYANNWGDDLKVEIPETGISISEVYRFLREWLGHETRVTGEVYRTATGIAVTARTGADVGGTYMGAESDLDVLVQKAAEHIYGSTQPYRYTYWLRNVSVGQDVTVRFEESRAILTRVTSEPNSLEQAWAWIGLGNIEGSLRASVFDYHKAIAVSPDLPQIYLNLANAEFQLSHPEATLEAVRTIDRLLPRRTSLYFADQYVNPYRLDGRFHLAILSGDYASAITAAQSGAELNNNLALAGPEEFRRHLPVALARQHDGIAALAYWRGLPPATPGQTGNRAINRLQIDAALENWQAVVVSEPSVEKTFREFSPRGDFNAIMGAGVRPFFALAKAKLGDTAGAEAVISTTASDCYDCIRMRGNIAAVENNWGRADYWFARAVHDAPSIPFAYADWGQALLDRGDPDAAIAKFTQANQKGPHFADPLEMWGEALMKKNRSDLALAKFEEAEKYAPQWGRLHLKWGEALGYAGRKDEAQKQFALAAGLDLSSADKAELAKVSHG